MAQEQKAADKAIRGLIKARFDHDDRLTQLAAMRASGPDASAHDRLVAIVAATFLEQALREAVEAHFAIGAEKTIIDLFEGSGDRDPLLGSLYGSSRLARALGIFDDDVLSDIKIIRDVRNLFAHSAASVWFASPTLTVKCNFKILEKFNFRLIPGAAPAHNADYPIAKDRYVAAIYVYTLYLGNYGRQKIVRESGGRLGADVFGPTS
jgi:hypothetical protein